MDDKDTRPSQIAQPFLPSVSQMAEKNWKEKLKIKPTKIYRELLYTYSIEFLAWEKKSFIAF